jgi:hypothetical protein
MMSATQPDDVFREGSESRGENIIARNETSSIFVEIDSARETSNKGRGFSSSRDSVSTIPTSFFTRIGAVSAERIPLTGFFQFKHVGFMFDTWESALCEFSPGSRILTIKSSTGEVVAVKVIEDAWFGVILKRRLFGLIRKLTVVVI